ncbi:PTS glucitol/sorbitol transporter subunit IIA [uncultured Cetobacterium sp.]|uniref:PTS glucitol/sorbitol transporter subunit IIA n=1 Tax=uncultured Cetobacterium sp. TaxID=527638 RepID=UPI0025EB8CE2|nr:PTS glucitol/sorbitol transporter subunit IIA [uncultured Cetobacterium sp.]
MKIYERLVTSLGEFLKESYEDGFAILFDDNSPDEYKDYCILHTGSDLSGNICAGDTLSLGGTGYRVTAVGDVVNKNLSEIGHITLKFDGETEAVQPGTLHLESKEIKEIKIGEKIEIFKN